MPAHDFKSIQVVPAAKDLVDNVLSKTQRKTPTVIHKSAQIGTHRKFYIRKVKTVQQNIHDKLDQIIKDFPDIKSLHKFYANLMNTLYGETEYKSALSHINYIKAKVDRISKDHVKLIKFGDSAYRCKTLKRVALGKMVKMLMKAVTKSSLQYLEECRQHLSRLPTIDTATRTVILCGYPNVGKSSFLNKISRADVDVQPYAFTTKSLFVGHCDYNNLRWQFIDTPGLLDRPLAECSTAEMLAITALDALEEAGVLFLLDLSEQCGYSISQQIALLSNIRSLFGSKPLLIALNKTDQKPLDQLTVEDRALIDSIELEPSRILTMSTKTEDGVMSVRNAACELVLTARINRKLDKPTIGDMQNRLYIADKIGRKSFEETVPEDVRMRLEQKAMMEQQNPGSTVKKTLFERQKEAGNRFLYDTREEWLIKNPGERFDIIPEIYNGHNIADFGTIDRETLEKFRKEEQLLEDINFYRIDYTPLPMETQNLAVRIKEAEDLKKLESIEKTTTTRRAPLSRVSRKLSVDAVREGMGKLGVTIAEDAPGLMRSRARTKSRSTSRKSVVVSSARAESIKRCDPSRARSRSGIRDEKTAEKVKKMAKVSQRKNNRMGKLGESDRHIGDTKPKHLFSGKRKVGKTDRR